MDIHTWYVITAMKFPLEDDNKPSQGYPGFSGHIDSPMGRMPSDPVAQPPRYHVQPSGHGFNGDPGTAVRMPVGDHDVSGKEHKLWYEVGHIGDMRARCKDPDSSLEEASNGLGCPPLRKMAHRLDFIAAALALLAATAMFYFFLRRTSSHRSIGVTDPLLSSLYLYMIHIRTSALYLKGIILPAWLAGGPRPVHLFHPPCSAANTPAPSCFVIS